MATDNATYGKAILTPEFRVSFASVFEPNDYDGKESFCLTMLFPKATDLSALYQALETAARDRWKNNIPPTLLNPFKDGDQAPYDGYEGMMAVKAANYVYNGETHKARPNVVDQNVQPILSASEFYSGCWARATVIPKATGGPGTKYGPRVSFGIRNLQKLRDDEPFGATRVPASDDFDPVPVEGDWGGGGEQPQQDEGCLFGGGNPAGGGFGQNPTDVTSDPLFG